jgi:hypothetical protein
MERKKGSEGWRDEGNCIRREMRPALGRTMAVLHDLSQLHPETRGYSSMRRSGHMDTCLSCH